jgi:hypothetical protein
MANQSALTAKTKTLQQVRHEEELLLGQVVTMSEAVRLWGKPRNTIMYAIDASTGAKPTDLIYRKSGRVWLITVRSLVRRWGRPPNSPIHP